MRISIVEVFPFFLRKKNSNQFFPSVQDIATWILLARSLAFALFSILILTIEICSGFQRTLKIWCWNKQPILTHNSNNNNHSMETFFTLFPSFHMNCLLFIISCTHSIPFALWPLFGIERRRKKLRIYSQIYSDTHTHNNNNNNN